VSELANQLFALRLVKVVLEIALLALAGQGLVWLLARAVGQDPANNLFYRLLAVIASPFVRLARFATPKFVLDRHLAFGVFALLFAAYVVTVFTIANTCIAHGLPVAQCQDVR